MITARNDESRIRHFQRENVESFSHQLKSFVGAPFPER